MRTHCLAPSTDELGLVTRLEARAAGWTDQAIENAVHSGRWRRCAAGVYAPLAARPEVAVRADLTDPDGASRRLDRLQDAAAAVRRSPGAVLSHHSAAVLWDLPLLGGPHPCVTVPPGDTRRRLRVAHVHRATLPEENRVIQHGYEITDVARTVLDLARERGRDHGVVAADEALRRRAVTAFELERALLGCRSWPGVVAARDTVQLADGRAESPLESISRLRLLAAGLPSPALQSVICDEWGRFVARVDFYWDEFGVVGESDGEFKYRDQADVIEERRRQRRLEDLGLVVERWSWADLRDFDPAARRLRRSFSRSGSEPGPRRWRVGPPPCV